MRPRVLGDWMTNEQLAAHQEICALKARYFRCMDCKDWDALEAVFAPDLIADFRDASGKRDESGLVHGAAHYIAYLKPMLQNVCTVHHGHMPEITLISDDEASGIWAMEDKLWPDPSAGLPFKFMHGYGHYHERYVKRDGAWRIAEIRLSRLRVDVV
jgi:hypothetical protein